MDLQLRTNGVFTILKSTKQIIYFISSWDWGINNHDLYTRVFLLLFFTKF